MKISAFCNVFTCPGVVEEYNFFGYIFNVVAAAAFWDQIDRLNSGFRGKCLPLKRSPNSRVDCT